MKIPFNIPLVLGTEQEYISKAIERKEFSGDGFFTKKCEETLRETLLSEKVLLTSSCTHALEMCALLIDIKPGDEVIMSSFNFVSAANAFVLRGAKVVFIDIKPDDLNLDEALIEQAITTHTKAILLTHYAGVSCNIEKVMQIANTYNLIVIEDAAHCIGSFNKEKHLGVSAHLGTLSFHATKNIHCGEGGALLINDARFLERADYIREKGTNRKSFQRGEVKKYTWVDRGSSYLTNELSAAFLSAQLKEVKSVTERRLSLHHKYTSRIKTLVEKDHIESISKKANGHIFYLISDKREQLITYLNSKGVQAYFHYIPLHSSPYGKDITRFTGIDRYTTSLSDKLLRLPMYYDLKEQDFIIQCLFDFFKVS